MATDANLPILLRVGAARKEQHVTWFTSALYMDNEWAALSLEKYNREECNWVFGVFLKIIF